MAHSMTVMPSRRASSLTSRSLVVGVNLATAFRWSRLLIPRLFRIGVMCTSDGSHARRNSSSSNVDADLILLIVEPDCVGRKGDRGNSFSTGVDSLYLFLSRVGPMGGLLAAGGDDRGGVFSFRRASLLELALAGPSDEGSFSLVLGEIVPSRLGVDDGPRAESERCLRDDSNGPEFRCMCTIIFRSTRQTQNI